MNKPVPASTAQKCIKCGKPKPNDKWTMCDVCDWYFTLAIFN